MLRCAKGYLLSSSLLSVLASTFWLRHNNAKLLNLKSDFWQQWKKIGYSKMGVCLCENTKALELCVKQWKKLYMVSNRQTVDGVVYLTDKMKRKNEWGSHRSWKCQRDVCKMKSMIQSVFVCDGYLYLKMEYAFDTCLFFFSHAPHQSIKLMKRIM